jgi:hypothetical protein
MLELNVTVERVALLLRFQKVLGSNLGSKIGYPETFSSFSLVPPSKCQDTTLN